MTTTDWTLPEVAQGYEDYDPLRERLLAYPLMAEALGLGRPGCRTVLDYGCGTGRVAAMLAGYGVSVVAADISPAMLGVAARLRSDQAISYRQIGADQGLDLPDASVDGAVTCFVVVTIPLIETLRAILAEVHRVLRPGATYAILDVNPDSFGIPFTVARIGEPGRRYGPGEPVVATLGTANGPLELLDYHWPKQTVRELLGEVGLGAVEILEPTVPTSYDGPEADLLRHEMRHPPYVIYLARR